MRKEEASALTSCRPVAAGRSRPPLRRSSCMPRNACQWCVNTLFEGAVGRAHFRPAKVVFHSYSTRELTPKPHSWRLCRLRLARVSKGAREGHEPVQCAQRHDEQLAKTDLHDRLELCRECLEDLEGLSLGSTLSAMNANLSSASPRRHDVHYARLTWSLSGRSSRTRIKVMLSFCPKGGRLSARRW